MKKKDSLVKASYWIKRSHKIAIEKDAKKLGRHKASLVMREILDQAIIPKK